MRVLARLLAPPLRAIPSKAMARFLARVANLYAKSQPPERGLRFLMDLDSWLYPVQGNLAVAHGDGLHTKHRHIRYHDFFCQRIQESERVLDIGCGVGALAHSVASRTGAMVTGIDRNEESVQFARQRHSHPNLSFEVGDAPSDLPRGTFDVVILSNVLEHIEDRVGFLRHVQSEVRADRWLIRVPLFERDWRVPLKRELGVEWRLDPTHFTEYTRESFEDEMTAAGFKISHLESRWGEIWAEIRPSSQG